MNRPFTAFQYDSAQKFFHDLYEYQKLTIPSVSFSTLASACDFKSRTEVRNILKGIKPVTPKAIKRFGRFFGIESKEEEYLSLLVDLEKNGFDQSSIEEVKELLRSKRNLKPEDHIKSVEIETSVLHLTLLSVIDMNPKVQTPQFLSDLLEGRYSADDIEKAISELENYGFIKQSDELWEKQQRHTRRYDYNRNEMLQKFHHECLELAKNALDKQETSSRYLVGASFCINQKFFDRIIQKMNSFVENLLLLEGVAGEPDTMVQFNQQIIKMNTNNQSRDLNESNG